MNALVVWARMIKLSHSVFALPFALASGLLASRTVDTTPSQWALIVLCMVAARASAMGFNRLVDRHFDAANPRTADREIPSGQISVPAAWVFTLGAAGLFVAGSALLGTATLALSPVALAIVWGYSLCKRFTSLAHVVLGVALGLSPIAVWIALTGTVAAPALLLSLGVATWVAGFDILYACQDAEFDRAAGLYSIPSRLGLPRALQISAALHVVTVAAFAGVALVAPMGPAYALGLAVIAGVLTWEHTIVKADDLSRLDKAFFDLNGYISLLFFASVWLA
jgi:4-hydroxybenzoate polyprenyltransferase